MSNINGNTPNLQNSKSVSQEEINIVKQNMYTTPNKRVILGVVLAPDTSSSTIQQDNKNV